MANWSKAQNTDAKHLWTGNNSESGWDKQWNGWADYYELGWPGYWASPGLIAHLSIDQVVIEATNAL
jgi:hypothetical protein